MKIAFMGAVGNNMYVMARAAHAAGFDILFVRDLDEPHVISQPFWQDVACRVPSEALDERDLTQVRYIETELGWSPPAWLVEPVRGRQLAMAHRDILGQVGFAVVAARHPLWSDTLGRLREADVILACGATASLLAWASGRPYILRPHGGDIRLAARLERGDSPSQRARLAWVAWLLRRAFQAASAIVTQDPYLMGGHIGDTTSVAANVPVERLPRPVRLAERLPLRERRRRLELLLGDVAPAVGDGVPVVAVPSRLDFGIKGQHRLLEAVAAIGPGRVHLVLTGWGSDLGLAQQLVAELNIKEDVTFLPFVLSKPLLYELFSSSDLAVDQFKFGTYGAAAPEAMGQSCPVLMHVDTLGFRRRQWVPPPVLEARTTEEIASVLAAETVASLDERAPLAFEWARDHHSPEVMVASLRRILTRHIEGGSGGTPA